MNHIPIHILQDRTSQGLQIKYIQQQDMQDTDAPLYAHRDDHYMFFVLEEGNGSMMVDFNEVYLSERGLYYVLPGQVHCPGIHDFVSGWFIAVDTSLIPQECRNVFESQLVLQQPYPLNAVEMGQCSAILGLILDKYNEEGINAFRMTTVRALLQSFMAIVAGYYCDTSGADQKVSRLVQLTSQFKQLLNQHLWSVKSPSGYAALLNVSDAYLSEVLKKQTGFPASYWIQQGIMMEAKRLLYYTELSIKEIAHQLGYTDHSYFSRFFSKATGLSATAFRQQYRE